MEILFVTREPLACALIASRLADDTLRCTIKDNVLEFYLGLQDEKLTCDLLALDFCQFQHLISPMRETLRQLKRSIPFVFYNDPYPDGSNRVVYWMHQNETLYEEQEFHRLAPVFTRLNGIIEDVAVRSHISLLCPPLPLASTGQDDTDALDLEQFRARGKIPPALFSLFEYFYARISKEISLKELSRQIFGRGGYDGMKRNCVYSYVSRLKKYIKADPLVHFDIIRSSLERYKMVQGRQPL